jgi:hypothetical protein
MRLRKVADTVPCDWPDLAAVAIPHRLSRATQVISDSVLFGVDPGGKFEYENKISKGQNAVPA